MSDAPTLRIWCENLAALDGSERRPLSELQPTSHIHGGLRLELGGRLVPYLGYFGPDDVCLGDWLAELSLVARAFEASKQGTHTFDEGEQGQPAFVFERRGDRAFFTIAPSEISDAGGDPAWQRIEFSPADFLTAHAGFREPFFGTLRTATPHIAEQWVRDHEANTRSA